MQARYYDPVIGRFLSVDPVGFLDTGEPGYFNRYSYTLNDPVNRADPDGEKSYLVSRPLNGPPGIVANHMFVVNVHDQTGVETRFSYGPQGDLGNPGKLVSHPDTSTQTGKDDAKAMKLFLSNRAEAKKNEIVGIEIDASDEAVLASGEAMNALLGTVDSPGENAPNYAPITGNARPAGSASGSISNFGAGGVNNPARAGTANSNSAAIAVPNIPDY